MIVAVDFGGPYIPFRSVIGERRETVTNKFFNEFFAAELLGSSIVPARCNFPCHAVCAWFILRIYFICVISG